MKTTYTIIILILFGLKGYSQSVTATSDSTILAFKKYLHKNIRYPVIAVENYEEGKMVISFIVNEKQKISDIKFIKHLTKECDSAVLQAIRKYPDCILVPQDEYTIGLQFFILEDGQADSTIKPFNGKPYHNFLFGVDVSAEIVKRKIVTVQ